MPDTPKREKRLKTQNERQHIHVTSIFKTKTPHTTSPTSLTFFFTFLFSFHVTFHLTRSLQVFNSPNSPLPPVLCKIQNLNFWVRVSRRATPASLCRYIKASWLFFFLFFCAPLFPGFAPLFLLLSPFSPSFSPTLPVPPSLQVVFAPTLHLVEMHVITKWKNPSLKERKDRYRIKG